MWFQSKNEPVDDVKSALQEALCTVYNIDQKTALIWITSEGKKDLSKRQTLIITFSVCIDGKYPANGDVTFEQIHKGWQLRSISGHKPYKVGRKDRRGDLFWVSSDFSSIKISAFYRLPPEEFSSQTGWTLQPHRYGA